MSKIIKIKEDNKQQAIEQAVNVLKQGGVIIFPTETVYGIGADSRNKEAIDKIYKIKKRSYDKPLSLHIGDISQIDINIIPDKYKALIEKYWPGPLTLICKRGEVRSDKEVGLETIGIRYPNCDVFSEISKKIGYPLAGTSANISNKGSTWTINDIEQELIDQVDLVIDYGETSLKKESTIVDISQENVKILRVGAVASKDIEDLLL